MTDTAVPVVRHDAMIVAGEDGDSVLLLVDWLGCSDGALRRRSKDPERVILGFCVLTMVFDWSAHGLRRRSKEPERTSFGFCVAAG